MKTAFAILLFVLSDFVSAQFVPAHLQCTVLDSGFIYNTAPFPSCHACTLTETEEEMLGPIKNKPIRLPDGRIHITYTYLRKKIKYVCLEVKDK